MWSWTRYSLGLLIVWTVAAIMIIWGRSDIKNIGTITMAFVAPYLFGILIAALIKATRNKILLWGVIYGMGMTVVVLIARGSQIVMPEALVFSVTGIIAGIIHGRTVQYRSSGKLNSNNYDNTRR